MFTIFSVRVGGVVYYIFGKGLCSVSFCGVGYGGNPISIIVYKYGK